MNILWVRTGRLVPVLTGGQIRTAFTIRELLKRHTVTLVSLYGSPELDRDYETLLGAEFPGAAPVYLGWRYPAGLGQRIRRQISLAPVTLKHSDSSVASRRIRELMESGDFDVAVCDFPYAAPNFPHLAPIPCVLYEHNVESAAFRSQARHAPSFAMRLAFWLEARRLAPHEARFVREFDHTVAVSEADAALLRRMAPSARVTAIGTGVDLAHYQPSPLPDGRSPVVMYTGMMSYAPNVDAVRWFCADIWPKVLAAIPVARFRIVGKDPAPAVRGLASENIEVTGEVVSVAEHLREASVVVVPLRAGGGTRLKIFEAMAAGRPVVSTHFGADGLDVHDGQDIIFADEASDFADEVVRLLKEPEHARAIAAAAAVTGSTNGWEAVVPALERILEDVVARRRGGS